MAKPKTLKRGESGNPAKRHQQPVEEAPQPSRTERIFGRRWVQRLMVLLILACSFGPMVAAMVMLMEPAEGRAWASAIFFAVLLTSFFLYLATYLVEALARWQWRRKGRVSANPRLSVFQVLQRLVLVTAAFAMLAGLVLGSYAQSTQGTVEERDPADQPTTGIPLFPQVGLDDETRPMELPAPEEKPKKRAKGKKAKNSSKE